MDGLNCHRHTCNAFFDKWCFGSKKKKQIWFDISTNTGLIPSPLFVTILVHLNIIKPMVTALLQHFSKKYGAKTREHREFSISRLFFHIFKFFLVKITFLDGCNFIRWCNWASTLFVVANICLRCRFMLLVLISEHYPKK